MKRNIKWKYLWIAVGLALIAPLLLVLADMGDSFGWISWAYVPLLFAMFIFFGLFIFSVIASFFTSSDQDSH